RSLLLSNGTQGNRRDQFVLEESLLNFRRHGSREYCHPCFRRPSRVAYRFDQLRQFVQALSLCRATDEKARRVSVVLLQSAERSLQPVAPNQAQRQQKDRNWIPSAGARSSVRFHEGS